MKNSDDTIENRTRDLPACSAVPQPTAPPRAPCHVGWLGNLPTFRRIVVPPTAGSNSRRRVLGPEDEGTALNIYQSTRRHVTPDLNLVSLPTHFQTGQLHNLTSFRATGMRITVIKPNQLRHPPSLLSIGCGRVKHTAIGHRLMPCWRVRG